MLDREQKQAIDDMISRRMENTGETHKEATTHIAKIFEDRLKEF